MLATVLTERHLTDIREKEKNFLLDALVLLSEFFGTSVETVVGRFREVKEQSAAFRKYILRRSKFFPKTPEAPALSKVEKWRKVQYNA